MPIIKSAIKRMKQTAVRRARNVETKKSVKTAVRAFTDAPSFDALKGAQSALDTAVKKNVLDKKTAARRKSNLVRAAKEAGVKVPVAAAKKPVAKPTAKKPVTKASPAKKATAKKPVAKK